MVSCVKKWGLASCAPYNGNGADIALYVYSTQLMRLATPKCDHNTER